MTKSFDDIVSNYKDPKPEWTVLINGKDYSNNLELLEFTDSVNNPLKFTVKLGGVDSKDNIPEDAEIVVKTGGAELFRGVLKQVEPNILNTYTFKGTGYAAELEGDVEQRFEGSDIQTVVDSLVNNTTTNTDTARTFTTSYSGGVASTVVDDFRAKKKQLDEVNRLMGEFEVEWYTTYDSNNEPVFNVTDQISFTDGGSAKHTLTTYGPNQSAEMVKQNANRNKGNFDGVLVRGYGDGDDQVTATAGNTGKGNRVLIYTDKTILSDSQAQKRADNINNNKSVSWQEIKVKPSNPSKIYSVGDELKIEAEDARLNDTYRVVESYFKYYPEEDEVESKLNLSNKPQTFVEDFQQQKEQTDSQTDYSQGNRNTINESVKELADKENPAKIEFNIPKRFTEDVTGRERTAQVRLDYVVDNYREDFTSGTQTTSTVIDSQTDVVSTDVTDFGDISRSQTKKEPRDTSNNDVETTSDFTQTDITSGGGGAQISSVEDFKTDLNIDEGGDVNLFNFDGGTEKSAGAVLYFRIIAIGSVSSGNYKQNTLRVKVQNDDGDYFPDFDGIELYYSIPNLSQLSEFDFDPNQTMHGCIFIPENTEFKDYTFTVESVQDVAEVDVYAKFAVIDSHKHGIPDTEKGGDNVQAYTFAGPEIVDIPTDDEIKIRGQLENELENLGEANKDLQQVEIVSSNDNDGVYSVDFIDTDSNDNTTIINIGSNTLDTTDDTGVVQYDIPSDKNSSQGSQTLPDENDTDVLQDVDAGDLILSEGATEATDVEIIVNGTSVTTKTLSSGPPYKFEDEDITSEVTKPGFNTIEIKPTGGNENGKALVKGNVVVDHKIEGERQ